MSCALKPHFPEPSLRESRSMRSRLKASYCCTSLISGYVAFHDPKHLMDITLTHRHTHTQTHTHTHVLISRFSIKGWGTVQSMFRCVPFAVKISCGSLFSDGGEVWLCCLQFLPCLLRGGGWILPPFRLISFSWNLQYLFAVLWSPQRQGFQWPFLSAVT